jgi:AhpD family alkylhydroperoxidase
MKLDSRIRELIAVGAAVTANCRPCLQYHSAKALESGAGADEIAEAVEVGKTVRKGAAAGMDKFAAGLAAPACSAAAPASGAGVCCS